MEENTKSQHNRPAARAMSNMAKMIISAVVIDVLAVLGFFGGASTKRAKRPQ